MSAEDLEVRRGLVIPGAEIREAASRSSGPGGQHVNKSNTRVTLRWNVAESPVLSASERARLLRRLETRITGAGDLLVHAQAHRHRARNRALARERLSELVRDALATRRSRVATRPTRSSKRRALSTKRRRGDLKRQRRRPVGEE
jgi:ribosome-associated protein